MLFREGDARSTSSSCSTGTVAIVEGSEAAASARSACTARAASWASSACSPGRRRSSPRWSSSRARCLPCRVERLRELVTQDPALGDLILRAFLLRRSLLIGLGVGLRIVGSRFSPDTRRLREFAARNRLPHRWIDLEEDHGRRGDAARAGRRARGDAGRHLARARGAAQPEQRRARPRFGLPLAAHRRTRSRPRHRRRRPRRAGRGGVRRLRGPRHRRARRARHRRPGGDVVADRELPRLPGRHLGRRARRAGALQAEKFGAALNVPAGATALEQRDGHYVSGSTTARSCGRARS